MTAKVRDSMGNWRDLFKGMRVNEDELEELTDRAIYENKLLRTYVVDSINQAEIRILPNMRMYRLLETAFKELFNLLANANFARNNLDIEEIVNEMADVIGEKECE